jgi:Flp pilus assembly pilin Flp
MTTQTKALVPANNVSKPRTLLGLIRDQKGAGMTEYIILVGVIAMLAIVAFKFFGQSVSTKIQQQSDTVKGINN